MKVSVKGFTLVEILIVVSITIVVSGLLYAITTNTTGLFYAESSKVEHGLNTNDALISLKDSIKQSSGVALSYLTYTSSADTLILKVLSEDSSGDIITDTFDYFVFLKTQDKLRLKVFPNALSSRDGLDQILSGNVVGILFEYLDLSIPPLAVNPSSATKIKITLSVNKKSGQGFENLVATSEATLRND